MTKHIHIHLNGAARIVGGKTGDSDWDESKHKRADNGQFGSGGGQAEKHAEGQEQVRAQAESHEKAMPKGSKVRLPNGGGMATVLSHRGNMVLTDKGEFHATKLHSGKPKGGQPVAPNLPGPRSQKAIQAIKAAAAKGDWRAVANVPVIGTHPQVHAYREAMAEHLQAGAKASREATHGTPPPTSLSHGGQKYTSTGKQGKGPDGVQHEYEAVDKEGRRTGARVWRTASGKVIPD